MPKGKKGTWNASLVRGGLPLSSLAVISSYRDCASANVEDRLSPMASLIIDDT